MISQGLLQIRFDHYNTLEITDQAKKVLFENEKVELVEAMVKNAPRTESKPKPQKTVLREELFEKLRTLRKKLADEADVPAFVIFNDKTLDDMVEKMPISFDSLISSSNFWLKLSNFLIIT